MGNLAKRIGLVQFDAAVAAIEKAVTIDEVVSIRNQAEAIRKYIAQQKGGIHMQNKAAYIKIRAEREYGKRRAKMEKNPGVRMLGGSTVEPPKEVPTLAELGVGKAQDFRWQDMGCRVTNKEFQTYYTETDEKNKEVTSKAVLKIAKKKKRKQIIDKQRGKIESGIIKKLAGPYDVIAIDPPWPYGTGYDPDTRRAASPYPEMSLEEIAAIDFRPAKDAVLWLWTTHRFMRHSFGILDAWGFEDKTILTWVKDRMGLGSWLRSQSEFCIMAVKGSPIINLTNQTTVISGALREHSRKPDEFYMMVESLCPGRRLDYFAREERKGWRTYGSETTKFVA